MSEGRRGAGNNVCLLLFAKALVRSIYFRRLSWNSRGCEIRDAKKNPSAKQRERWGVEMGDRTQHGEAGELGRPLINQK